jgi:hypothetical protein
MFWTFFVCLFLLTTIVVLLHVYEDDIKQYAIDEINEHLTTDLKVQSIELSFFHDFPRASLEFRNVLINDAFKTQESSDTLLHAKRAFCSFNIWDIWNGDYKVKRISLQDSKLNLRTTKKGDVNYDIIKESEDTTSSNFKFVLDLLRVDRMAFQYSNLATGQLYKIDVRKSLIQGDFTSEEFGVVSESDVYIRKIKSNSLTLIRNKPARIELNLDANTIENSFTFTKGDITIGKMPFELTGKIDTVELDLQITGKEIELADLANSLAAGTMPDATRYQGTGILNFESEIKGPISSLEMPSVTAHFDLENGTLTNPSNNLKIHGVQLEGNYQNAQSEREELLSFKKFNLKLLNSYFNGSGEVRNFEQPSIIADMKGLLDLETFHRFFRIPGVEKIGGSIDLDMAFAIQFHDPEYRQEKFSLSKSKGTLSLKNVIYKHLGDALTYQNISGEVVILDDDAAVKDLSIKTEKSDLKLNGAFNNLLQYLSGTGGLGLIATLESDKIDLNEFIGETNTEEMAVPVKFELPNDLNLNLDLDITNLIWDNHEFKNVTSNLILVNRKATASNVSLNTLGGTVKGWVLLDNLVDAGNVIESKLNFSNINVKGLFTEWKNFDQESITDKHLSGTGNGSIDLLLFFNPYFSIIEEKIYALTSIEIKNGELNDLETMRLITDYMRSNNALKLMLNKHIDKFEDKLLHLKFATLSNTIEIKDRKIYIPKMLIKSNALSVELFGWHDFDNNVEYHFSFRFRDLKSIPEYTEFGKIEDDGLGIIIYLTMSGPLDNPTFALDNEQRKNDLKENMAQENQTIKSMLKTEFGLFKNDSTVQKVNSNQKQVEFIFYDEEEEEINDSIKAKEKNKGKSWKIFDKLKQDNKKEKEEGETEFGEDL